MPTEKLNCSLVYRRRYNNQSIAFVRPQGWRHYPKSKISAIFKVLTELFSIAQFFIVPAVIIVVWMLTCYPVCNKAEGFDWFLYWIIAGCPFGIRRMCLWLIPKNFSISGSIGVLALNCIIGGLIGGVVLIFKIIGIAGELISIVTGHFWTKSPKVEI